MELTWLGTAAFRIVVEKTVLLLDPFLSRPRNARPVVPVAVEDIATADYILLSHGHFDHAYDAARLAARTGARILAPASVCNDLRNRGVPDQQLRPLHGVETIGLTDLRVRGPSCRMGVAAPRRVAAAAPHQPGAGIPRARDDGVSIGGTGRHRLFFRQRSL